MSRNKFPHAYVSEYRYVSSYAEVEVTQTLLLCTNREWRMTIITA